jgi:hypothetical protein
MQITRIISGGQTGVDRAALDVAIELGVEHGGWVPKGRRAEDGPLDEKYGVVETPSENASQRTEWNVRDADGTLIVASGQLAGGTELTKRLAAELDKPHLVVDPWTQSVEQAVRCVSAWAASFPGNVLNVAGPRESEAPMIYGHAYIILKNFLLSRQSASRTDGGTIPTSSPDGLRGPG